AASHGPAKNRQSQGQERQRDSVEKTHADSQAARSVIQMSCRRLMLPRRAAYRLKVQELLLHGQGVVGQTDPSSRPSWAAVNYRSGKNRTQVGRALRARAQNDEIGRASCRER